MEPSRSPTEAAPEVPEGARAKVSPSGPPFLVGRLERVTYRNPENGFVVARVKARGWPDLVTVVGPLGDPLPGEVLKMQGRWGAHPKFGEQFEVVRYETALPATAAGIEKYLGSGLVKGIGPGLAARIVRVFGAATLEIVDKDPKRLAEVEGIGTLRADRIRVAWGEQREIRNVMLFLQSHGVGPAYAIRIWKRYGTSAVKLLQENPYRLATDVWGIGFLTADRIAGNLGFPPDAPQRAEAGLLYALNRMSDEGHLCAPLSELVRRSAELLEIDGGVMEGAVARVEEAGYLVVDREAREGNPLEPPVYLKTLYLAERGVAGRLAGLLRSPCPLRPVETAKAVPWAEKRLGIELAEGQREALIRAVGEKVLVLTGGPGTGKTTLIRSLLEILSHRTDRIALAAPTGRAAKRMAEATGREAKTIHRLLEWSSQEGDFQRNEENPLECDLLVLDETSMLDIPLANRLLAAVPPGAKLILVGDGDQLPSVGPGSFLADLVASGVVPVARLSEIFRQARSSRIVVSAHRIRDGLAPERVSREERDTSDFHFIPVAEPERIAATLVSLVKEHIPRRFGLDPMEEIQVLTPMKRGLLGAASLNAILQEALNPGETLIRRGSRAFRGGDRVMQIRNDYDRDVYNGDIGRVLGLDGETGELEVRFDDRVVRYAESDLDELIQAYAVTIHKSQGSEYPAVVMPLHTQHYMMLQRNLLYTGVTRGRKLVCIVGSPKALNIAVRNDKTLHRYGRLAERLRTALDAGSPSAGPTAAGAAAPGGDKPGEDASETVERPRRRKRRSLTKPEGGEGS